MMIEGRDLVDFGHREFHLMRQRYELGTREMAVMILKAMEIFDQQIATPRLGAEQRLEIGQHCHVDFAAAHSTGSLFIAHRFARAIKSSPSPPQPRSPTQRSTRVNARSLALYAGFSRARC